MLIGAIALKKMAIKAMPTGLRITENGISVFANAMELAAQRAGEDMQKEKMRPREIANDLLVC